MSRDYTVSPVTYENYVANYQRAIKNTPMDTPLYTMSEFARQVHHLRGKGIKNIARFVANAQRTFSPARVSSTRKFARDMWDELKRQKYEVKDENGKIITKTRLDDFKKKFPEFKRKGDLKSKNVLERRDDLFEYFRKEMGYSNDDIDRIFSPEEEDIKGK